MTWTESADFRKFLRREVRKQAPWVVVGSGALVAFCIFVAIFPSWLNADPGKRLPIWAVPVPPLIAAALINALFVVLPERLSKNRVVIRENGIEYGVGLIGKQWLPLAQIHCYLIGDETTDTGDVFTFLEIFRMHEADSIALEIPANIGKDRIRAMLSSLGLTEELPEQ